MNETIDISLISMIFVFLMLLFPVILFLINKIDIFKDMIIAILRMTIQLVIIGFLLQYLFKLNFLWLTGLYLLIMILVADYNVIKRINIKIKGFIFTNYLSIGIAVFSILLFLLSVIIKPNPLWDAKYLIPLAGMLCGNSMNANSLAIERFYKSLTNNKKEYYSYIHLGATIKEASYKFIVEAYKASLLPTIGTMTALGIVSLPGMMTGQILGGNTPIVAIKYQIMIMISIFTVNSISALLIILFTRKAIINKDGIIIEK